MRSPCGDQEDTQDAADLDKLTEKECEKIAEVFEAEREGRMTFFPCPNGFRTYGGNMPGKRLSPKVQDLPGAGAVAQGHGGMVPVFYGVEDGRPNRKERMR